ncbi:hypothetical protein DA89_2478 [Vibrio paracholerae]|nr:hypothetical protein DA89_2478 [Vibrio paracholerae]
MLGASLSDEPVNKKAAVAAFLLSEYRCLLRHGLIQSRLKNSPILHRARPA